MLKGRIGIRRIAIKSDGPPRSIARSTRSKRELPNQRSKSGRATRPPTAQQIMNPSLAAAGKGGKGKTPAKGVPDHGQKEASDQVQKGVLPDLNDMKQGTDQHAKEVEDAVKETNK